MPSTHYRSLVKAATWEIFSWFLTAGVAYGVTGSYQDGSNVATACLVVKIVFLYLHERIWKKIRWGKL